MVTRRGFLSAGLTLSVLSTSGCVTQELWEDHPHWYSETVQSVLLSADGKTLVFISPKYHYIFEAPPELVGTLRAHDFHAKVKGQIGIFRVDRHGKITGTYTLRYDGIDPEMIAQAQALGYQRENNSWKFQGKLTGLRYTSNGVKAAEGNNSTQLTTTYRIDIHEEESSLAMAGKVLATPVTVAADGVLIIGGIALAPIALIFFFALVAHNGLPIIGP